MNAAATAARSPPAAVRRRARSLDLIERLGQQRAHRIGAGEVEPRSPLAASAAARRRQAEDQALREAIGSRLKRSRNLSYQRTLAARRSIAPRAWRRSPQR